MKGIKFAIWVAVYFISLYVPLHCREYTIVELICMSFFSLVLMIGATIDMQFYILPDEGAIGLAIVGGIYNYMTHHALIDTWVNVVVVFFLSIILRYISNRGFGWGDIKWLCAISIWLTSEQIVVMIYSAVFTACLYSSIQKTINKTPKSYIPFGPFLAVGAWNGFYFSTFWSDIYWFLIK